MNWFALGLLAAVLLSLLGPTCSAPQGPKKFTAQVLIKDTLSAGGSRSSPSIVPDTLYYEDKEPTLQWLRLDISGTNDALTEIYRYGGFNIHWTNCAGKCTFQDIFNDILPILYSDGSVGAAVPQDLTLLNGTVIPASLLELLQYPGTDLYVLKSNGNPVRAIYSVEVLTRQIDFVGSFDGSGSFDSDAIFSPPDLFTSQNNNPPICENVDPSCYRIDVVFVIDGSGSIRTNWRSQISLIQDLVATLQLGPNSVRAGYQVFRTKAFTELDQNNPECCVTGRIERLNLTDNLGTFENTLDSLDTNYPWTSLLGNPTRSGLVDGVRMAFVNMQDNGRPYARRVVVAITDSAGSSPCCTLSELSLAQLYAGVPFEDYLCNLMDCTTKHNAYVTALYAEIDSISSPAFDPDVFVLGIGTESAVGSTIDLVARIGSTQLANASVPGNPEIATQRVSSFSDSIALGAYETAFASALNPLVQCAGVNLAGTSCANDCIGVTGGYCCSGSCDCLSNCSAGITSDCIYGVCETDGKCSTTDAPNGTACDDGKACTINDTCNAGTCRGAEQCPSNNTDPCKIVSCGADGTCITADVPNGTPCNDGKACTINDTCNAGTCTGTVNCSNGGNECVTASCGADGTCITADVPNGTPCNDGDPCTINDTCSSGVCKPGRNTCNNNGAKCNSFKFPVLSLGFFVVGDVEMHFWKSNTTGKLHAEFSIRAAAYHGRVSHVDIFVGQLASGPFRRLHQRFDLWLMKPSEYPYHSSSSSGRVWRSGPLLIDSEGGPFSQYIFGQVETDICKGRKRKKWSKRGVAELTDEDFEEWSPTVATADARATRALPPYQKYEERHISGKARHRYLGHHRRWREESLYLRVHARVSTTLGFTVNAFSSLFCNDPLLLCCRNYTTTPSAQPSSLPSLAAESATTATAEEETLDPSLFDFDYTRPPSENALYEAEEEEIGFDSFAAAANGSSSPTSSAVVGMVFGIIAGLVLTVVALIVPVVMVLRVRYGSSINSGAAGRLLGSSLSSSGAWWRRGTAGSSTCPDTDYQSI